MSSGDPGIDTVSTNILSDPPPSYFADKLGTNYVPSAPERADIRRLVRSWAQEIARMDEKRATLKEAFDAHRALISPMRRTPDDLLRKIFLACLPTLHNALMDPNEAPIIFGRICRRWRDVAHSTPMLWSSVHVPSNPTMDMNAISRALKRWLERSGSCTLDISLYALKGLHDFPEVVDMGSTLSILLNFASRLHRLSLTGDLQAFQPLLLLGADSLPRLNTLHLNRQIYEDDQVFKHATKIIGIPSLTSVSLSININALSLPLRWSRLRTLYLWHESQPHADCRLGLEEWLEILRRCPNLQRCEVNLVESYEYTGYFTFSSDTAPITLPSLETLKVWGDFQLSNWVPRLSVPNLLYLRIGYSPTQFRHIDIPPTSSYMVGQIDCSLLSLSALCELLSSFPKLSHLQLLASVCFPENEEYIDDTLLAELCPPRNLCQRLTHLVIHPHTIISHAAVSDFIRARMHSHTPLQQVEAHVLGDQVDIAPDIQSFVDDGLRLDFEYRPVAPKPTWRFHPRAGLDRRVDFM
ncbi:hypothetical protein R3P38DRAFT_3461395 [Favolaschia claudopus]|uniref:F-box domain-containing protein n=1 Tax=Favolaschia claudopus TaxID=2862362 RepID=A0AAW0CPW1_9AGAR